MRKALVALTLLASSPAAAAPDGKAAFTEMCAPCHGAKGNGRTPLGRKWGIPDFTTAEWQGSRSDDSIRETIKTGRSGTRMRPFGSKLSAEEIESVLRYLRTFGRSR